MILMLADCTYPGKSPFERKNPTYRFQDSVIRSLGPTEAHRLVQAVLADTGRDDDLAELEILNPYHGAVFPLDMASPEITWEDSRTNATIWLVFSSKVNTPFTQLFLAHIDAKGNASVPVLLSRFSSETRACLVPEFVNIRPEDFPEFKVGDLTSTSKPLNTPSSNHSPIELSRQR